MSEYKILATPIPLGKLAHYALSNHPHGKRSNFMLFCVESLIPKHEFVSKLTQITNFHEQSTTQDQALTSHFSPYQYFEYPPRTDLSQIFPHIFENQASEPFHLLVLPRLVRQTKSDQKYPLSQKSSHVVQIHREKIPLWKRMSNIKSAHQKHMLQTPPVPAFPKESYDFSEYVVNLHIGIFATHTLPQVFLCPHSMPIKWYPMPLASIQEPHQLIQYIHGLSSVLVTYPEWTNEGIAPTSPRSELDPINVLRRYFSPIHNPKKMPAEFFIPEVRFNDFYHHHVNESILSQIDKSHIRHVAVNTPLSIQKIPIKHEYKNFQFDKNARDTEPLHNHQPWFLMKDPSKPYETFILDPKPAHFAISMGYEVQDIISPCYVQPYPLTQLQKWTFTNLPTQDEGEQVVTDNYFVQLEELPCLYFVVRSFGKTAYESVQLHISRSFIDQYYLNQVSPDPISMSNIQSFMNNIKNATYYKLLLSPYRGMRPYQRPEIHMEIKTHDQPYHYAESYFDRIMYIQNHQMLSSLGFRLTPHLPGFKNQLHHPVIGYIQAINQYNQTTCSFRLIILPDDRLTLI